MPRFKLNHRYGTQTLGPWPEGTEVDLTVEQAAQVERDSPGALTEIAEEGAVSPDSTKAELVAYAEENGIDLGDAKTKAEIVDVLFAVSPDPEGEADDGAMSSEDLSGVIKH